MTDDEIELQKLADEIIAKASPEQLDAAEELDFADLFAKADAIMANPIYDDETSGS